MSISLVMVMIMKPVFFQGCLLLSVAATVLFAASDPPQKSDSAPKSDAAPQTVPEVLDRHVRGLRGAELGTLSLVSSDSLRKAFPNARFFSLFFRKYPSEVVPTPPLKSNNLFVLQGDKVVHIASEKELSEYFVKQFPANVDEPLVKAGTESWLRLAQELRQDGFYEFAVPELKGGAAESQGTLAVKPKSGKGEIKVTLKFKNGRLVEVIHVCELSPGRRLR